MKFKQRVEADYQRTMIKRLRTEIEKLKRLTANKESQDDYVHS
jgi:hypothetical protein